MGHKIKGRVISIGDTRQVTERFRVREVVLELQSDPEKHSNEVPFELTQDRCETFDQGRVGDIVELEFSLNGRSWNQRDGDLRRAVNLTVWHVEVIEPALPAMSDEEAPI